MKKIIFLFVLMVLTATVSQAQTCACDTTPFKPDPPCWNVCTVGLLGSVGVDQLIQIIGIRANVAYKIADWPRRSSVSSFREYSAILTEEELVHVASRINSLTDRQLRELRGARLYSSRQEVTNSPSSSLAIDEMR